MGKYPNNLYKYFNQYTNEEIKTFGLYSGVSNLTADLLAEKLLEWSINATSRVVDDTLDLIGDVKNSIDNWKDFIFSNSWLDSDGIVKYSPDVYEHIKQVYDTEFYSDGGRGYWVQLNNDSFGFWYDYNTWYYNPNGTTYVCLLGSKYAVFLNIDLKNYPICYEVRSSDRYTGKVDAWSFYSYDGVSYPYKTIGIPSSASNFFGADVSDYGSVENALAAFFGSSPELIPNDKGYETITTINPITPTALVSNNYNTTNQTINLYYASGGSDINEILDEIIESYEPEEPGDSSDYVDYQNGLILGLLVKGFEDAPTYIDVFGRAGTVAINIDEYPYTKILNGKTKIIANTYFNAVLYNKPQVTITWEVK